MAVKVTLREKEISKGRKSLYLDFYPAILNPETGKETRREFLRIYIYIKPKNPFETQHNKEARALARNIQNQRFREIQEGSYDFNMGANKKKSFLLFFKNLCDQKYTSKGNYDNWLSAYRYFSEYFENGLTMGKLSVQTLEEYRDHLLSLQNLSQNTKTSYFSKVKAAVKEAHRKGMIPENYAAKVKGIKAEETKREFVTLEELKLLMKTECRREVIKNAFVFSALTGLRFVDIQKLTWKDLQGNGENGFFIRFRQKKTKAQETLPIPLPARKLLGERQEDDQAIFKGLAYSSVSRILKEWVEAADINKNITFHCARHSFATIQLDLGTDIYTVSKLLGHKELKTTQIYAKIMDRQKKAAMNKLNDFDI